MLKLGSALECVLIPVEITQPFMDGRISRSDVTDIRFEMLNIDGIKTDDCRVESHITFCDMLAPVEWSLRCRQVLFNFVKRLEQRLDSVLIRILSGGEAAFINSVIYVVIYPGIRFINLLSEAFWV